MNELFAELGTNSIIGMISAALAVIVGTKFKEVGIRMFIVFIITAMLASAAIIETWFSHSTIVRSATIGWVIGYVTDDVMMTFNALLPDFVRDTFKSITAGVKNTVDKWFNNR